MVIKKKGLQQIIQIQRLPHAPLEIKSNIPSPSGGSWSRQVVELQSQGQTGCLSEEFEQTALERFNL